MKARIYDPNLSGPIEVEVESVEALGDALSTYEGVWHEYAPGSGVALLNDPTAHVFVNEPDPHDPYPDWVIERDADGISFTWYEA